MTNITLSIDDEVYKKMKEFSEIKWSEFVRKIIMKRINELESIEKIKREDISSMVVSENVLKKDWENENDSKWDTV